MRKAINKLAKIGEYVVIKNFVDDDTLYVMGFVDSFVQKLVLSHSETGLIVLFKYSQVKKPLLILWKEMKSYEVLEEDNLICFDFFYSDVRLYVPYDNNLIKVFKRMTGVVDV